jgi:hypothetical protein
MPLDDAVVYNDKVYGAMGPYVLRFNGTTGAVEDSVRVVPTGNRPMRIATHAGMIYVSHYDNPATPPAAFNVTGRGIYPVNPTTMELGTFRDTGTQWTRFGSAGGSYGIINERFYGPGCMLSAGGYLWTVWQYSNDSHLLALDTSTSPITIYQMITSGSDAIPQQLASDGTDIILAEDYYFMWRGVSDITYLSFGEGSVSLWPFWPICGVALTSGVAYFVNGTETVKRYVLAADTHSDINIGVVQANVQPLRIQYRAANNSLYIPCMNQDGVIVWNLTAGTGTWVGGLACPIDVVFTSTKVWAVQNSITPLVDIT